MEKLSNQDYRHTLQEAAAAVVEFTSPTCGHCKVMQGVLEQIENSIGTRVSFYQADIVQAQDAVLEYDVRSVPTFIFIKNGEVRDRMVGEVHRAILEQAISRL